MVLDLYYYSIVIIISNIMGIKLNGSSIVRKD